MIRFPFYALLVIALYQTTVLAEECIDMQKHAAEVQKCCDIESPLEMENIQACKEKYEQELSGDLPNLVTCIFDCHAAELGIIDGDNVNEAELLKVAENVDPTIKEVVLPVMKECVAAGPEMVKQSQGHNMKCHPLAYMMTECIMRGIFANCPDSHWTNSPVCEQLKAGAKPC